MTVLVAVRTHFEHNYSFFFFFTQLLMTLKSGFDLTGKVSPPIGAIRGVETINVWISNGVFI